MKDVLDDLAEALAGGPADDVLAVLGVAVTAETPAAPDAQPVESLPAVRDEIARPVTLPMPLVRRQLAQRAAATAGMGPDRERLPWPDEWFDAPDSEVGRVCHALWGEVFRRCLIDVAAAAAGVRRAEHNMATLIAGAHWLASRDFHEVAALAGFDGQAVLERLRPTLAQPERAQALYHVLVGEGRRVNTIGGGNAHKR